MRPNERCAVAADSDGVIPFGGVSSSGGLLVFEMSLQAELEYTFECNYSTVKTPRIMTSANIASFISRATLSRQARLAAHQPG